MERPSSFYEVRSGVGCPLCAQGRPAETARGARFFAGEVVDGHLRRADVQRGLSIVLWHGRHVVEPTELGPDEAAVFSRELLEIGRAIEAAFQPVKMNYNLLGNDVPHLHAHVVPRYATIHGRDGRSRSPKRGRPISPRTDSERISRPFGA